MKQKDKNNVILVTGGAGYIGSKFSYDAIDAGYQVIIVDNLTTGDKNLIPKKAIFYKCNVINKDKINKILFKHKIKTVVHFAASTSVSESMKNPDKYYHNNTEATKVLLKTCISNNVLKFIFSSTAAVYGASNKKIISEKDKCKPKSHYGKSKLLCEKILRKYSKDKISIGILRYFNVIGADKNLRTGCINNIGQLFKNLSENINKKKYSIKIFGKNYKTKDGTCERDFIDINDLTYYHLNLLKLLKKNKYILLNCGYKKSLSVLEIVEKFEQMIKIKIKKKFIESRKVIFQKLFVITKS